MQAQTLFDIKEYTTTGDPNPCVYVFGKGPRDAQCATCTNLKRFGRGGRHWYKCMLRRSLKDQSKLGNRSTDHRVGWNACAKYTTEEQPWMTTA